MRNFKHHKQRSNGFTMVPNEIFMDRRLDDKTLGVLCRLLSLPEDWNFSVAGLTKLTNSGRDSIRASLNKLEELGYLVRERVRDENGRLGGVFYHIYEIPLTKEQIEKGELEPTIPCDYYYDWMNE